MLPRTLQVSATLGMRAGQKGRLHTASHFSCAQGALAATFILMKGQETRHQANKYLLSPRKISKMVERGQFHRPLSRGRGGRGDASLRFPAGPGTSAGRAHLTHPPPGALPFHKLFHFKGTRLVGPRLVEEEPTGLPDKLPVGDKWLRFAWTRQ